MALNRRTPLRRTAWGQNKSEAQRERDAERKLRKWIRRYHSLERVYVVQRMTCIVPDCGRSPCEVAHGRDRSWRSTNPLCATHHRLLRDSYHGLGSQAAFEERWLRRHGLTWDLFAEQTDQHFQENGEHIVEFGKVTGDWARFLERSPKWLREAEGAVAAMASAEETS